MPKEKMWMYKEFKRFAKRFRFLVAIVRCLKLIAHGYRKTVWYVVRPWAIKKYLRSHQIRKLQIGAKGNILKDWLNTDLYPPSSEVVFLNATQPFPFENSTFDYIFCEHLIEHLTYHEGLFMLRECYRILKPGGRIRIATPDFEKIVGLYLQEKSDFQHRYLEWAVREFLPETKTSMNKDVFVINNFFYCWEHKFIYDRATLQETLEKAAFAEIFCYPPGESDDKNLRCLESHGRVIGNEEMNQFETMVLEARRPL